MEPSPARSPASLVLFSTLQVENRQLAGLQAQVDTGGPGHRHSQGNRDQARYEVEDC